MTSMDNVHVSQPAATLFLDRRPIERVVVLPSQSENAVVRASFAEVPTEASLM